MNEEPLNGFTGFAKKKTGFRAADEATDVPQGTQSFDRDILSHVEEKDRRWAWVEIDLNAIRHNVREAKRCVQPGCKVMAVVKADAYGHGAVPCAKAAINSGAEYLGVATVDEGLELRDAGINVPILILAQPPEEAIEILLQYKLLPTIFMPDYAITYAEAADRHGMKAPYHLAINSGMNRIGVHAEDVIEFMRQVSFHRALELEGTFTHFATADMSDTLDFQMQVRRFVEAVNAMRTAGIDPGIVHAANSAAIFRYPDVHFDMVRLGISLYGFHPCAETRGTVELHPAMSVHARITATNKVPVGEGVSYGLNYRSPGSVTICTVPIGYADGLRRALSGRGSFILDGRYCHQVGNICMDQCMFEVDMRSHGNRPRLNPQVGDEVIIVGAQGDAVITIDEMAHALESIQHEVAIGFSHRMPLYFV